MDVTNFHTPHDFQADLSDKIHVTAAFSPAVVQPEFS